MKYYHYILLVANIILAVGAGWHALLFKRDPRASQGWIAVILLFPLMGPFIYFLFGINRVRTRARKLTEQTPVKNQVQSGDSEYEKGLFLSESGLHPGLSELARISQSITEKPLVGGNKIEALHNGEETFPAMIEAIEEAKQSIYLSSYIFETNETGRNIIDSLGRAKERGVDVKVILDGVGEYYSFPRAGTLLKKLGVKVARFLPPRLIPPAIHINLRNHRKILTVDGQIGFLGGMNIGDRHLAANLNNPSRVVDMHFRLTGPVVNHVEEVFLKDWQFCTGEQHEYPVSSETHTQEDGAICRVIIDGPDDDFDKFAQILMGIVSSAKSRIWIMTPYFLPSRDLTSAMRTAALRGVDVKIILPSKNNLPYVHWATRNLLWEFLERGVEVYYQPPPFVHTKLLVVDEYYSHVGSANIDPRSLRLNFEITIEIYDSPFNKILITHMERVLGQSTKVSLEEVDSRSLPARTRDALAWLFTPYL